MVTRAHGILERKIVSPHLADPGCIMTYLTVIDGIFGTLNVAVGTVVIHVGL